VLEKESDWILVVELLLELEAVGDEPRELDVSEVNG
jgi:hypothetical protein